MKKTCVATVLMTSVDTAFGLCVQERRSIMQRLGLGQWQIFGTHGMKKDDQVSLRGSFTARALPIGL
jgi:hypothetical protein